MDLYTSQIFLGLQTEAEYLPLTDTLGYYTPKTMYYAILGDFGSVQTNRFKQKHQFPIHIGQDIYRLFRDIESYTRYSNALHSKVLSILQKIFKGYFSTLESIADPKYGYLKNTTIVQTLFKNYSDILPYL
jgi:hypothetical protein